MLPRQVLHKSNGHARPAAVGPPSPAEMLRLVHSTPEHASRADARLLRFAHLVRSERAAALLAQAAQEMDGLRAALLEAVARTQGRLEAGAHQEVQAVLERLRAEAEAVTRLVRRLAAAADASVGQRRVLHLDDVIDAALERLGATAPGTTVVRTPRADLPPVVGHAGQLREMLLALLAAGPAPGRGTVRLVTSCEDGALRGDRVVRVHVVDARPHEGPGEAEVRLAAGIARDHGGSLIVEPAAGGGRAFTIDLPAL
jgi:signal transduction histidine kinase